MSPKKVDINQPEIVAALREAGATVSHTHMVGHGFPDLVAGVPGLTVTGRFDAGRLMEIVRQECPGARVHSGANLLLEVKNPEYSSAQLTKPEAEWHGSWRGQKSVVWTAEDALSLCGLENLMLIRPEKA